MKAVRYPVIGLFVLLLSGVAGGAEMPKGVKLAVEPAFDWAGPFADGRAQVLMGDRWGYINTSGRVAIEATFEEAGPFSDGIARVVSGGKVGFIDRSGDFAIEPALDDAFSFSRGMAPARRGDKWGYIDDSGEFVIEPAFDWATSFDSGRAMVRTGGRWGYIDKSGTLVIGAAYGMARPFSEGRAAVNSGEGWSYIDTDGAVVIPGPFETAGRFSEGLAQVTDGSGRHIIDTSGAVVAALPFAGAEGMTASEWFSEGLMPVDRVAGTAESAETSAPRSEDTEVIEEPAGTSVVRMGYVDKKGEVVIDFIFEDAGPFAEGLAPVKIDGKWGYIKKSTMIDDTPQNEKPGSPGFFYRLRFAGASSHVPKHPDLPVLVVDPDPELREVRGDVVLLLQAGPLGQVFLEGGGGDDGHGGHRGGLALDAVFHPDRRVVVVAAGVKPVVEVFVEAHEGPMARGELAVDDDKRHPLLDEIPPPGGHPVLEGDDPVPGAQRLEIGERQRPDVVAGNGRLKSFDDLIGKGHGTSASWVSEFCCQYTSPGPKGEAF